MREKPTFCTAERISSLVMNAFVPRCQAHMLQSVPLLTHALAQLNCNEPTELKLCDLSVEMNKTVI